MNKREHLYMRGFTIVELLIVIVVIAILAAITIVAYNGIQQRSRNTQRIAAAKEWQKIITSYTSVNGAYPPGFPSHDCLGTGYETNWDSNPDEDCAWSDNIKHPFTNNLNAYKTIASFPNYPTARQSLNSSMWVGGISLRAGEALDPSGANKLQYPTLLYWLDGNNQDCVLRPIVTEVSGGIVVSVTAKYTKNDGYLTQCRIALPDPAGL